MTQGESLLEGLVRHGASLPHECEGALVCASCRVTVREGLERLQPAGEDEQDRLGEIASDPAERLACRAFALGGDFVVEIPHNDSHAPVVGARFMSVPVALSERAVQYLTKQLAKHAGAQAVRFAVRASGCSGYRYVVDYADAMGSDDAVFESGGLRIVVDAESLPHISGTTVELKTEGLSQRLRFNNPNASQTCGCGESFNSRQH